MSHREFIDPKGYKWDVWRVDPTSAERRKSERRASAGTPSAYTGEERRGRTPDRRVSNRMARVPIVEQFKLGWLCFESSTGEKRRLMPVPENWEAASLPDLLRLLKQAKSVVRCGVR